MERKRTSVRESAIFMGGHERQFGGQNRKRSWMQKDVSRVSVWWRVTICWHSVQWAQTTQARCLGTSEQASFPSSFGLLIPLLLSLLLLTALGRARETTTTTTSTLDWVEATKRQINDTQKPQAATYNCRKKQRLHWNDGSENVAWGGRTIHVKNWLAGSAKNWLMGESGQTNRNLNCRLISYLLMKSGLLLLKQEEDEQQWDNVFGIKSSWKQLDILLISLFFTAIAFEPL